MRINDMTKHGTASTYSAGCRCAPCRDASTSYHRERRAARKAKLAIDPTVPHGTMTAYRNHGCRCVDCLAAQKVHGRKMRAFYAAEVADNANTL